MSAEVAFRCAAPAHQAGEGGPDKLTVHDGGWAFCPFSTKAEDHVWVPTAGRTLFHLVTEKRVKGASSR